MADTVTVGEELEHRVLDTMRRTDTVALETLKVLTHAMEPMAPAIRSVTPPLVLDFTRQFIVMQRKFAADVLHLTERIVPAAALSSGASQIGRAAR